VTSPRLQGLLMVGVVSSSPGQLVCGMIFEPSISCSIWILISESPARSHPYRCLPSTTSQDFGRLGWNTWYRSMKSRSSRRSASAIPIAVTRPIPIPTRKRPSASSRESRGMFRLRSIGTFRRGLVGRPRWSPVRSLSLSAMTE